MYLQVLKSSMSSRNKPTASKAATPTPTGKVISSYGSNEKKNALNPNAASTDAVSACKVFVGGLPKGVDNTTLGDDLRQFLVDSSMFLKKLSVFYCLEGFLMIN